MILSFKSFSLNKTESSLVGYTPISTSPILSCLTYEYANLCGIQFNCFKVLGANALRESLTACFKVKSFAVANLNSLELTKFSIDL